MKRKNILLVIIGVVIFCLFVYSYFSEGRIYNLFQIEVEDMTFFFSKNILISILIYFILMVFEVVFAPLHPLLFYIAGGIVFGPVLAITISVVGGIFGGTIAFFIARKWGRGWIEKKVPKEKREKFDKFSEKHGGWAIFLLRINPLTSTDLWNYVAGLSKVKFWHHIVGTTAGLIPATALMIYFGVPIQNNPLLFKIFLAAIIIYLILGILLFLGVRRRD